MYLAHHELGIFLFITPIVIILTIIIIIIFLFFINIIYC